MFIHVTDEPSNREISFFSPVVLGTRFFELEGLPDGPWRLLGHVSVNDGTSRLTGLLVLPRDDYDGPVRDQELTADRVRRLPLRQITAAAALARAAVEDEIDEANAHLTDLTTATKESLRVRGQQETLQVISALYRMGERLSPKTPRRYVISQTNYTPGHVDRLIRAARKQGLLTRFPGGQGRHGKSDSQEMNADG